MRDFAMRFTIMYLRAIDVSSGQIKIFSCSCTNLLWPSSVPNRGITSRRATRLLRCIVPMRLCRTRFVVNSLTVTAVNAVNGYEPRERGKTSQFCKEAPNNDPFNNYQTDDDPSWLSPPPPVQETSPERGTSGLIYPREFVRSSVMDVYRGKRYYFPPTKTAVALS